MFLCPACKHGWLVFDTRGGQALKLPVRCGWCGAEVHAYCVCGRWQAVSE